MNEAYNMDCMKFLRDTPDKSFDLCVCDPPYGINAESFNREGQPGGLERPHREKKAGRLNSGGGKLKNRVLNRSDASWDYEPPTKEYFVELFRVSRNQVIWGGNYFVLPPTRGILVWDKMQPWSNFSQVEMAWTSFDTPAKIFRLSNAVSGKIHPCQKPVELYKWIYGLYAKPGMKILDTHLGSGSSRIAAWDMGIDFVGTEIDPEYFEKQEERFKRHISQPRLEMFEQKVEQERLF